MATHELITVAYITGDTSNVFKRIPSVLTHIVHSCYCETGQAVKVEVIQVIIRCGGALQWSVSLNFTKMNVFKSNIH